MKRIVELAGSALLLAAAVAPALSLNLTASFCNALSATVATRTHPGSARTLKGAAFAISTFDERIVEAFSSAWQRSGNGISSCEGVVLILRMADGTYSAREMGSTNEYKRFTFRWHPATIAIVHTHPSDADPKPHDEDIVAADKHGVPIFTITSRGMYVYDPVTKKTSLVMQNLDWLDPSKWSKAAYGKQ
jgi:hypothetical protein